MRVTIVAAASDNNVIGNKGKIPWHIPADLKRLRERTMGHPLIMGRRTHEAIGKALPGRRNIVVTHRKDEYPGCEIAHSLDAALAKAHDASEVFIFGGGDIYRQSMKGADRIELTRVHATVDGDVYFPEIDMSVWKEVSREDHPADGENEYPYSFIAYEKKEAHHQ